MRIRCFRLYSNSGAHVYCNIIFAFELILTVVVPNTTHESIEKTSAKRITRYTRIFIHSIYTPTSVLCARTRACVHDVCVCVCAHDVCV